MASWNWGSIADWAQAISSTVVLLLIYMQMRQVNTQMVQTESQERFRRSWEFVSLYRAELRDHEITLEEADLNLYTAESCSADQLPLLISDFFRPRIHLFILLNQLVQHQEVDERVLFGYLEDEFDHFVKIGVTSLGAQKFKTEIGGKMNLLLTLWGSHIKSSDLLFAKGN